MVKSYNKVTKENEKEIVTLYKQGFSSCQIAKKQNRSSAGVRLVLRRNKIELRTQSEANIISEDVRRGETHFNYGDGFSEHKGQVYFNLNHNRVKYSHYIWCITNGIGQVPKHMIIHHIDGNFRNNNPENLILLDQSTHMKVHAMINDEKFLDKIKTED